MVVQALIMSDQAKSYSENADFQKEDGLKFMSHIDFHDGMKILDLGCGTGNLSSVLAAKVGQTGQVVGIDPDKARIALAQETYGSISNLTFQVGDAAEAIPGPPGDYDAVFSNYVFHWIKDKKSTFENVFRCLKPGGCFVLTLSTKPSPFSMSYINLLEPTKVNELMTQKIFYMDLDEVIQLASANGFSVQHKMEDSRVIKFANFDVFTVAAYGMSGGLIDSKSMDPDKLQELKQRAGSGEIKDVLYMGSCVFTK